MDEKLSGSLEKPREELIEELVEATVGKYRWELRKKALFEMLICLGVFIASIIGFQMLSSTNNSDFFWLLLLAGIAFLSFCLLLAFILQLFGVKIT
jgi:site-specific recombinase XerD